MIIHSPPIVFLLLTLFVSFPHFNNASVLDACKAAAESSSNINLNFCVKSLQSDPTSISADSLGLAKIATELAAKNAKNIKTNIKKLLTNAEYGDMTIEINTCRSLFSHMIYNLAVAADALSHSNYDDAKTYLSASLDAPCDCDDAFKKQEAPPVLADDDETVKQLTAIALALLNK
jgi:pectinesterase inhibitor-like protein